MEAPLGYMDEKELVVQKPKKPPEIQVWTMLVSGPLVDVRWVLGLRAFSGLAQNFSWLQVWASGFGGAGWEPGQCVPSPVPVPCPLLLLRP